MHEVVFFSDIIEVLTNKHSLRPMPKGCKVVFSFEGCFGIPTFKVCHYNDEAYVWFRGTQLSSKNDVAIDIDGSEVDFLNGKCHSGYLNASRKALSLMTSLLTDKKRVVTLGHSLWGACASITAMILKYEYKWDNVKAFTLATPGIISEGLAAQTADFITTFVRAKDPIPRIFNMKRGPYSIINSLMKHHMAAKEDLTDSDETEETSISSFYLVSADRVPGRVIVLDSDSGEAIARKKKEGDFELDVSMIANISAHFQRLYDHRLLKKLPKDIESYKGKFTYKLEKDVECYQIMEKKKASHVGIVIFVTCVMWAVTGPIGAAVGTGLASCVSAAHYYGTRNHVQIANDSEYDEEKEKIEKQESNPKFHVAEVEEISTIDEEHEKPKHKKKVLKKIRKKNHPKKPEFIDNTDI